MVVEDHYGPAGQIFYDDGRPDGGDGPVAFDSVAELLVYDDEQRIRGLEDRAVFVTDYSSVDYELEDRDGVHYVSTHAEREAFADATELYYVVDSEIRGAMGPDHLPFSRRSDADDVSREYGGAVRNWGELSNASE